jgi:parallel beta-helix repeat protein/predicted outer membrane repeat protein
MITTSKDEVGMKRFLLTAVFLLYSATALANTLYVPDIQYTSIQSAINDANHGDTIVVSPGIYVENIDFLGKAVTLRSTDPNDPDIVAATIIDGSTPSDPNLGSVVTFANQEDANSILSGFTIQNGTGQSDPCGDSWYWKGTTGGGVFCRGSSPTIRRNIFINCRVAYGGGAIYCHDNASPVITENRFENNYAGSYGGGVFARLQCSPTISNNVFNQNSCKTLGGAVYLADQCTSKVTGNRIEANISTHLSGAGIYYFVDSNPTIANNLFISNSSKTTGSGIMVSGTSTGTIINNLFIDNEVRVSTSYGAVIGVYSNPLIANNIIASNDSVGIYTFTDTNPVLSNNNVWDNEPNNYTGHISDPTGSNGNLSQDPLIGADLPEPLACFELNSNSVCIDAGTNTVLPGWLTGDYDGTGRIVNSVVDIGPQENYALFVPQDYNSIQQAITASATGGKIIVSPGFYQENLDFEGKNLILRSINPLDPCCVDNTIIDGNDLDSCITLDSGEDKSSIIAGLNIQNGSAEEFGGGIYIADYGGCTILYNYIHDNYADRYGGGIDTRHYSDTSIRYNRIINNSAYYAGGGIHVGANAVCDIKQNYICDNDTGTNHWGGGIYCFNYSVAEITENEICHNTTGYGAGIYAWRAYGLIARNHVWDNHATVDGGGIGIHAYWTEPYTLIRIQNNLVEGNKSNETGGGIGLFRGIHEVYNNTVVNNESWVWGGSGIATLFEAEGDIANNIVAYNKGGPGIYVGPYEPNANPQFYSNLLWDNEGGNYGGIIPDLTDVNGNLTADPCFVSLGFLSDNNTPGTEDDYWVRGNYKIGYFSPAKDTADPNYTATIEVDIDNAPRPHFEGFDRGCYELQVYDFTTTGTVDITEMALFVDLWLDEAHEIIVDIDGNGVVDFRDYAIIFNGWNR